MRVRWLAPVLLAATAIAVAVVMLGGGSPEYRIVFSNAGQLVQGDVRGRDDTRASRACARVATTASCAA
jgi:hypothetical protein